MDHHHIIMRHAHVTCYILADDVLITAIGLPMLEHFTLALDLAHRSHGHHLADPVEHVAQHPVVAVAVAGGDDLARRRRELALQLRDAGDAAGG